MIRIPGVLVACSLCYFDGWCNEAAWANLKNRTCPMCKAMLLRVQG